MKIVKLLTVLAIITISVSYVNAQALSKINEASFFKELSFRYFEAVQHMPQNPVIGKEWTFKFPNKEALDASGTSINWGDQKDRYLKFVAEVDKTKGANSLIDDVNKTTTKYNIALKLFERDGSFVKVISKWGNIIGIGECFENGTNCFVYEAEGKVTISFNKCFDYTRIVKNKLSLTKVTKLSELTKINMNVPENQKSASVQWYDKKKGYGFIKSDDGSSYFFTSTSLKNNKLELKVNDQFKHFDVINGKRGPEAINIE